MPSNTAAFTIEFASSINLEGVSQGVRSLVDSVSKLPPLVINTGVRNIDTGDAQGILTSIQQQATAIDKVTAKQVTYTNAVGATQTFITQLTTTFKSKTGDMLVQTDKVTNGIKNLGKEWVKTQEIDATTDIGGNIKKFEKHYQDQTKAFDAMEKKATEWSNRAETMGAKEAAPLKQSIELLREKRKAYDDALSKGVQADVDKASDAVRKQNIELDKNIALTKRSANAVQDWGTRMGNAIKQSISYALSLGLMRIAQQQFNQALQYTIDLNKEMTKIQVLQVEGASTPQEINALADSYNRLAIELGSTTLEVARGSVEWLRQGKSISETRELLRSSTMLSKLGNIEAAESTEFLTSALNGYNLEAEKAVGIVDKLVAVDNVAATSAKELATALRYSSAVASQAGVSIEELISYIGVISSTTRQNAEMIGQALKTIFTRMQDIKQGGLDEDGLGINNVERALERVDIKLRDSETSFRNMSDVLEDVAAKWETLNEVEQANIAKAMAGVRQQNMFMILMTNMNKALALQQVQYNSAGLAADRYDIYLKSVEAAQNRVKASLEGLYQDAIEGGFIVSLLDATSAIIQFIDSAGGIPTVIMLMVGAMILLKAQTIGAFINTFVKVGIVIVDVMRKAIAYEQALISLGTTQAVVMTAGAGAIVLAIVAIGAAFYYASQEAKRASKAFEEATQASADASLAYKEAFDATENVKSLWEEYEALKEIQKVQALDEDQKKRLIELQNELNELSNHSLAGHYNETLDFQIDENANLTETNELLAEQLRLKEAIARQAAEDAIEAGIEVSDDLINEREKLEKKAIKGVESYKIYSHYLSEAQMMKYAQEAYDKDINRINEIKVLEIAHANDVLDYYKKLQTERERIELMVTLNNVKNQKQAIDAINAYNLQQTVNEGRSYGESRNQSNSTPKMKMTLDDVVESAKELQKELKLIADSKALLDQGKILEVDTKALLEMGIVVKELAGGGYGFASKELDVYNEATRKQIALIAEAHPDIADQLTLMMETTDAVKEQEYSLNDLISVQQTLSDAIDEFNSTGELSLSTVMSLIDAGYSEAIMFDSVTGKAYLNEGALRRLQLANADLAVATAWAKLEAFNHVTGLEAERLALLGTWRAAVAAKDALAQLGGMPMATSAPSGGGGGGGKSEEEKQYEAEIKAIEKKIDAYEDEKKALKEKLDLFKEYIDAQKESLQRAKEESDWNKELAKKSTDLAKIKARIALLALDDSAEARAERLKLEEQAGELETEITEDKEDRKYDLQIQALDDLQKAFEDKINAQIDAIDKVIDKYKEEIERIREVMQALNGGGGGGGGGGGSNLKSAAQDAYNKIAEEIKTAKRLTEEQRQGILSVIAQMLIAGATADELDRKYRQLIDLAQRINLPGTTREELTCFVAGTKITMWNGEAKNIEEVKIGDSVLSFDVLNNNALVIANVIETFIHSAKAIYTINGFLKVTGEHLIYVNSKWTPVYQIKNGDLLLSENGEKVKVFSVTHEKGEYKVFNIHTDHITHNYFANGILSHNAKAKEHYGGIVEAHHDGDFAGNLQSNEVFARLLKGEYVATEGQMNNFLKNVLPKMMNIPTGTSINEKIGDTSIQIHINVEGSLDKSVLPDLKSSLLKEVNKAMQKRGVRRSAGSFSI